MNLFFYFIFQKPYFFIPVGYPVNLVPIMGKITLSPQPCSGPFVLNQVLVCFLLYFFYILSIFTDEGNSEPKIIWIQ